MTTVVAANLSFILNKLYIFKNRSTQT
jgi:hypothetical protein